jgi:hypothetical protein
MLPTVVAAVPGGMAEARLVAAAGHPPHQTPCEIVDPRVRQAERDEKRRSGLTTDEKQRIKELERENAELRRANEILKTASAFFAAAELDRRPK